MWVSEFGRYVKPKIEAVFQHVIAKFDASGAALFKRLLEQEWFQNWIKFLSDVLQEDWCPELDAILQRSYEVQVRQFDDMQIIWFLHVLDVFIRLT